MGSLHIWLFRDPAAQTTHNNKATTPPAITAQQQRTIAPVTPQWDQDQDRESEGPRGGVPGTERPTPRAGERLLLRLTAPSEAYSFPRTTEMTHAEVTGVKVRAKTKQRKPGAPQGWFSLELRLVSSQLGSISGARDLTVPSILFGVGLTDQFPRPAPCQCPLPPEPLPAHLASPSTPPAVPAWRTGAVSPPRVLLSEACEAPGAPCWRGQSVAATSWRTHPRPPPCAVPQSAPGWHSLLRQ